MEVRVCMFGSWTRMFENGFEQKDHWPRWGFQWYQAPPPRSSPWQCQGTPPHCLCSTCWLQAPPPPPHLHQATAKVKELKKREGIIVNWLSLESHLNDWVRTPHVLDGKAGIPRWSLALNERRNLLQTCSMREKVPLNKKTKNDAHLRVRPQTSSAHLEDCPLVLHIVKGGGATVVGAARLAVRHHGAQLKLL